MSDATTATFLEQDARLGAGLAPAGNGSAPAGQILLTGVTGFLGGEIAGSLLRSTAARLHCLVRGKSGRPAAERLARACRRLGLDSARVVLVEGDLAGSALAAPGMADRIDTVVHCAATVNLFAPYQALRGSNVLVARAVLEFAAHGSRKAIHFVSTTGIFLSPRYRGQTVYEDETVRGEEGLRNGYTQSKWAADTMMTRARDQGFDVTVYRPAFVGWHSGTGRHGEHDLIATLLHSSLEAGCAPRLDLQINSAPVDEVARIVAKIASSPSAYGGTYHVVNTAAIRFIDLARMAGIPLVALPEWEAAVTENTPRFAKLATMVHAAQCDERSASIELELKHNRTYDDTRLREVLGQVHPIATPMDAHYLARLTHEAYSLMACRNRRRRSDA